MPFSSTREVDRLDENPGAASVEPTPDDLAVIAAAAAKIAAQGAPLPKAALDLSAR